MRQSNELILGGLGWTRYRKEYQRSAFLKAAVILGVKAVDTAIAYRNGDSESSIGGSGVSRKVAVQTKIGLLNQGLRHPKSGEVFYPQPSAPRERLLEKWFPPGLVEAYVVNSLTRLQVSQIDTLLLHSPGSVAEILRLEKSLERMVDLKLARRFGISLDFVLPLTPEFDVLQISASMLPEIKVSSAVELQVNRLFRGNTEAVSVDAVFKTLPPNARPVVGTRSIIHLQQNLRAWRNRTRSVKVTH